MTRLNLFIIAILVIAADFITKYLVYTRMALHETIKLPVGFLQLTYVQNFGGAFGIFPHQRVFFVCAALAAALCVLYFFNEIREMGRVCFTAASLLFGGSIGNLIDRIRFGYVVDFLDLRWWPVFNVADIALTVGVALLFIELVLCSRLREDENRGLEASPLESSRKEVAENDSALQAAENETDVIVGDPELSDKSNMETAEKKLSDSLSV
ncbi:MAG: signal peptidase II [Candidatus Bruticola sp.]